MVSARMYRLTVLREMPTARLHRPGVRIGLGDLLIRRLLEF